MVGAWCVTAGRALLCAATTMGGLASSARADWLDDMPSVAAVARAVRDEIRESNNPNLTGDPDYLATQLAGTFVLLRWFMLFEALREANPATLDKTQAVREPNLSAQRRARMDAIATEYRQVELAIERGVGKRNGSDKKICDRKDTNLNRFGQKMSTPEVCHMERYRGGVDALHIAFAYRKAIFPRLFCDKGPLYHERFHDYFVDGDGYRPPGQRPIRPHNFAFVVVKQWPEVTQPMTTAAVCAAHGGDENGDGLCDAWQSRQVASPTGSACRPQAEGPNVRLGRIWLADDATIRVAFTREDPADQDVPSIKLYRGSRALRQVESIEIAAPIKVEKNLAKGGPEVAVLTTIGKLDSTSSARPRLTAVARGRGGQVSNDVTCKQIMKVPLLKMAREDPGGFFGPYDDADKAACAVAALAIDMTKRLEVGTSILTGNASKDYYLTSLVEGTWSWDEFLSWKPSGNALAVTEVDYKRSLQEAVDVSCRLPWPLTTLVHAAGTLHTHPNFWNRSQFSSGDIKYTRDIRVASDKVASGFERNYLAGHDGAVYSFDGKGGEQSPVTCPSVPTSR